MLQTQRAVRMYDLAKQELVRKLLAGVQCISSMAVHPAGDNLLVGSYDRKCVWYVRVRVRGSGHYTGVRRAQSHGAGSDQIKCST